MQPNFKFLIGQWQAEIWNGQFFETWEQGTDGTCLGMGRHELSERVNFLEFMSIERSGEGWILFMVLGMLAQGHKTPVPFELERFEPNLLEFGNERNAFPAKIVYRGVDANNLECTLLPGPGNAEEAVVFAFHRVG